jgi:hypothetical protein
VVDSFNESFEDTLRYPQGQHVSNSIWGVDGTYSGNIFTENVGVAAYDGSVIINYRGNTPISRSIMFTQRNGLPDHWISISYKMPRVKLPTNINYALVISGAHFAMDENGFINVYNPTIKDWVKDTVAIPIGAWTRITVHRNHIGQYTNIYIDGRLAFSNIPIYGPDLNNYIRISFSSAGEYDLWIDWMLGLPYSPF